MSEILSKPDPAVEGLLKFARAIMTATNVRGLIAEQKEFIDRVTPHQAMEVLDRLITEGFSVADVKSSVGKILNIFYLSLAGYKWAHPGKGHFISNLMLENREAEKRLHQLRELTKLYFNGEAREETELLKRMLEVIRDIKPYEIHYLKKEIILFPYIERSFPSYRCLQVMWAFHDDFRQCVRHLEEILTQPGSQKDALNKELGKLFFTMLPVIFREEHIIFPVALRIIPEKAWEEMLAQSIETGWCYIEPPVTRKLYSFREQEEKNLADLGTGWLSNEQLKLMLNNLPVDITFVDENNIVQYFSGAKHRIFPRTKAIIGREVQNCHPPDSVDVVEEILDAFRNRKKDHADFWITMRDRFIHIRYFALYDESGNYKGTIEVSQDVTEIRGLEGEQRLLDWQR